MLSACSSIAFRTRQAESIASAGGFTRAEIKTSRFQLLSYHRLKENNDTATIYIEGDGLAFTGRYRISLNPTPINPVSLKLALLDTSANVIYIARPCQYISMEVNPQCNPDYWTIKRYAPEVITAINEVIDEYKNKYKLKFVRLAGFSGGGTVATLLAAQRDDVIDLRTMAGNLDIVVFTSHHNVSPLTGSLNPKDFADKLYHVPQIHFVGETDEIIPLSIAESYRTALRKYEPELRCIYIQSLGNVSHTNGWESKSNIILNKITQCRE